MVKEKIRLVWFRFSLRQLLVATLLVAVVVIAGVGTIEYFSVPKLTSLLDVSCTLPGESENTELAGWFGYCGDEMCVAVLVCKEKNSPAPSWFRFSHCSSSSLQSINVFVNDQTVQPVKGCLVVWLSQNGSSPNRIVVPFSEIEHLFSRGPDLFSLEELWELVKKKDEQ